MIKSDKENSSLSHVESVVDRRDVMRLGAATLAALFSSAAMPRIGRGEEIASFQSAYRLRDLEKSYALWQRDAGPETLPSFATFEEAVQACRSAACSIHHVNDGLPTGGHSGFLVTIPKEHMTQRSETRAYIVTCDHARALNVKSSSINIILSNGSTIFPREELIEAKQRNGFPTKDLRIFECNPKDTHSLTGLPLRVIPEPVPSRAAIMIYEPLGLRAPTQLDSSSGKVRPALFSDAEPRLEKFVLTSVSDASGPSQKDPDYPANSGFMTGGQLYAGGSGSPAILFDNDTYCVGGYQVGYMPVPDTGDRVDGELQCDGHVIHANNIISLLRKYGAWK